MIEAPTEITRGYHLNVAWFSNETLDFFGELELNNDRDWFAKHKKHYEKFVKEPMELFAAEMIERMKQINPEISMQPKDAVFRIYRDTRFSKDKTPYKTNAGISIARGGKTHASTGVYFHLDAHKMGIASGRYFLEPPQLAAIRSHIAKNLDEFEKLLADKDFKERFGTVAGEKNKILPADLREAAAKQPLLFNKQFYYWAEHDGANALRDDLADFVMLHVRAAVPMNTFLSEACETEA